jgi:hypothetical protein
MALYGLLDAIKERPGLFRIDSVESIFHFISGYQFSIAEYQVVDDDLEHFEKGFLDWVRKSYTNAPPHADWLALILLYSVSRSDSVTIFFSLLDKYRISTGRELTDPQSRFIRVSMSDMP